MLIGLFAKVPVPAVMARESTPCVILRFLVGFGANLANRFILKYLFIRRMEFIESINDVDLVSVFGANKPIFNR